MEPEYRDQVDSAISAVQAFMVILLGLGANNGLTVFFRNPAFSPQLASSLTLYDNTQYGFPEIFGLPLPSFVCLLLLLIMVFRFYYINARYLDDSYCDKSSKASRSFLMFEFFCIVFEGILISMASFFVHQSAVLLLLFAGALVIDGI